MKHKLCVFAGLLLFSTAGVSQQLQLVGSAGEESSSSSAILSYSVGELVVANGANDGFSQGYQQSNLFVTGIDPAPAEIDISIYPNPATDRIIVESSSLGEFGIIRLLDSKGALVWGENGNVSTRVEISLADMAAGNYLLELTNSQKQTAYSYKIIKTH